MQQDVVAVADGGSWLRWWDDPVEHFDNVTPQKLQGYRVAVLAPGHIDYAKKNCNEIIQWKREGLLPGTKLILGSYKVRHIWTKENDAIVDRWLVHSMSERKILDSDKLVFVPLTQGARPFEDVGYSYVFMGGRKWRELDVGIAAIANAGLPGLVVTDCAPEGEHDGIRIIREKVSGQEYRGYMSRARVVGIPLKETPISHGQTDAVHAVCSGRPSVITAGASCDEYVWHGQSGLLVQGNTLEAWADALRQAWENADSMAAEARRRAPMFYSPLSARYIRDIVDSLLSA